MNNKTLKRVVAFLATALLVCSCAFAATIDDATVTYDATSGEIVVPFAPGTGATKAALLVRNERTDEIVALAQFNSLTNVVAFEETIDTTKVVAGDTLAISVGDDADESTLADTAKYTVPVPVVKYTVTYDETVTEYEAGTAIADVLPTDVPTKEATAQYTYEFAGWLVNGVAPVEGAKLEGNIEITAAFTETVRTYAVKFVNADGTELQNTEVAYGETPVYAGETPTKAADENNTYTFAGWTPEIVAVTGEATYTATYEATPIVPEVPDVKVTVMNGADAIELTAVEGKVTLPADTAFNKALVDAKYILTLDSWVTADESTTYAKGEAVDAAALDGVTLYAKYLCNCPIGDVNGDGIVNNTDGNAIKYFMVGQRENRQYNVNKPLYEGSTILLGNVNTDNVVNNTDGNAIKYFMVGQRENRQYNVNKPLYVVNK